MPSDLREVASYLANCTQISRGNFVLARLDRASHLEHSLRELMRELMQTLAAAELAEFLHKHGEAVIATSPRSIAAAQPRSAAQISRLEQENAELKQRLLALESGALKGTRPDFICRSNWFPVQDNDVMSCQEKAVCWAIFRDIGADDRLSKEVSYTEIGKRCSLSAVHVGRLVRELCDRKILGVEGPQVYSSAAAIYKGGAGQSNRYQFLPRAGWLAVAPPREPRAQHVRKREEARFHIGAGECRMWGSNCEERALTSPVMIEVKTVAGEAVRTIYPAPGNTAISYPVNSRVETAPPITRDMGTPITRDTGRPAVPAAPVQSAPPISPMMIGGPAAASSSAISTTPITRDRGTPPKLAVPPAQLLYGRARTVGVFNSRDEPVCDPDLGALRVDLPAGKILWTEREEKDMRDRPAQVLFDHFLGKGLHPHYEPLPAKPKSTGGDVHEKVAAAGGTKAPIARGGFSRGSRRPTGALPGQPGKYSGLG